MSLSAAFLSKFLRRILPASLLLAGTFAFAQAKPRITSAIDVKDRTALPSTIPAQARQATDLGRISPDTQMKDIMLLLGPTDAQKADLDAFLAEVQNPASAQYHQWLTPAQFGARFSPAPADVQAIVTWLSSQGFQVTAVAAANNWIRFSGPASQVEAAFGAEMHSYRTADGKTRYANTAALSLPRALSGVVTSVLSLSNFERPAQHTMLQNVARSQDGHLRAVAPASKTDAAAPAFTSLGQPEQTLLAPGDFARIYDTLPLVNGGTNGKGVSIAIVGRSDIALSDIEAFRTIFKLPTNDPVITYVNGDPGTIEGDNEEATLDTEWAGAVAPMATIQYVVGASTINTDGVDISAAYIVDHAVAPIMSLSFGECEQALPVAELAFYNSLWQQASAEGISVLVSAADAGSSACVTPSVYIASSYGLGVSGLASTPYNTAVGGTQFNDATNLDTYWNKTVNADLSSAVGYIPEQAWNESCNPNLPASPINCWDTTQGNTYAGGGGASNCANHGTTQSLLTGLYTCTSGYTKPSWQAGTGVPADNERDLPDVSLAAAGNHDGYLICVEGSCQWTTNSDGSISLTSAAIVGGTSASAPSLAGIMALVEQKNGQFQGLLNPKLYALSAAQTGSCDSSSATDPTKGSSCVFHDVTAGSNSLTCSGTATGCTVAIPGTTTYKQLSGWAATAGYDLSTGLGSVDASNLVTAWSTLKLAPTTTTLTVSSTTFTHGTPVTVTTATTPTSGGGTPSGNIALVAAGTLTTPGPVFSTAVTAGGYSGSISKLPGGTYTLTSQYGGDATYAASSSQPVSLTVAAEPSVMTAKTEALSTFVILGRHSIVASTSQPLNNTWYVAVNMAGKSGNGIPSGTVSLANGSTPLGTYPLDKTGAVMITCGPYTQCDLPIGTYTLTVTYSGDSSFGTSTTTLPYAITKGTANIAVVADHQYAAANAQVIATVYIEYDPAQLPTGTVTLFRTDTNATLGTAQVGSDGTAVIPFLAPVGTYFINAKYSGDANYTAGYTSQYPELIVTGTGTAATTTAMSTTTSTATLGQRTPFTFTVTPTTTTTSIPTGTITLYSQNGQIAAAVPLVNGKVTEYVEWDLAGTQNVYAVYSGDKTFSGSSSSSTTVTVGKAGLNVVLSTSTPYVAVNGQGSVTAMLTTPLSTTGVVAPTGTIQFYDSLNGATAVPVGMPQGIASGNGGTLLATLAPNFASGTHVVTAEYSGDSNWNVSTSAVPVTIVSTVPGFTLAGPSALTITAGQTTSIPLTSTSVLGFNTSISVACTGAVPEGIACGTAAITPGSAGSVSIASVAPGETSTASMVNHSLWEISGGTALAALFGFFLLPRRRRIATLTLVVMVSAVALTFTGCGSDNSTPSPIATTMLVTSTNSKAASGTSVTLIATLANGSTATGNVTFMDGSSSLGTASVTNGRAELALTTLPVGTHPITASYAGDATHIASSSSDTLQQTITGSFKLTLTATAGTTTQSFTLPVTLQ